MSRIENHIAVISQTKHLNFSQVQDMCAGIDAQLHEDAYPIWGRRTHISAFNDVKSVPQGYWMALIQDNIHTPGAAGFHTDEHNQPKIYVQYDGDDTSVTLSHEAVETIPDPFGNRLIPVNHPELGHIRILCEISDPPEAITYEKKGIKVSDFIVPSWYDTFLTDGMTYSFTGACKKPLELLKGGYFSFLRGGVWEQVTFFGSEPSIRTLGKLDETKMLREWIDAQTAEYREQIKETPQ